MLDGLPPARLLTFRVTGSALAKLDRAADDIQGAASCVRQIADGDGKRAFADIDAWGYTFRLGSAQAYFEQDADDAWAWLQRRGLIDDARQLLR